MKIKLAAAGLLLVSGGAFAADLPSRKAPSYFEPVSAAYWNDFYVGINGGYAGNSLNQTSTSIGAGSLATGTTSSGVGGPVVGGQLGFNHHLANNVVLGGEIDMDWADVIAYRATGGSSNALIAAGGIVTGNSGYNRTGLNWLGTARARIGYDLGRFMPYITGGLAVGEVESRTNQISVNSLGLGGTFASVTSGNASNTQVGWVVGAGAEYMLTDNISAKAEYLYTSIGGVNRNDATLVSAAGVNSLGFTQNKTGTIGLHQIRAGLNYHLNFGAPIIAAF